MNPSKRPAPTALLTAAILMIAGMVNVAIAQDAIKSQAYAWKNVTVGGGGFIPGIVFSRAERGLAYIRSDMGGFYRWDDRQKTWLPLNDAMAESSYQGGESVAPDPVDPNVVYLAAGMYRSDPSAMLRSRDRGKTWSIFPVSFKMGGNEDGRGMGERLAVDPNSTNILLFGSRHNGLMRSENYAESWSQVQTFPLQGLGEPPHGSPDTHGGLSFVVFDPHSSAKGIPSKTIFVGSTDPGPDHLFRSDDAGQSWTAVSGGPGENLVPLKGEIDDEGLLYLTCCNAIGPNGVTKGGVFTLDTRSGKWTDITPVGREHRLQSGYCGLSLDRQHPGTLAVTTLDRWYPGDTVFRTTDGGKTWNDIAAKSERDISATPFLLWGTKQARLGWWMTALAIDPFDSDHAVYATGATVYATHDFNNVSEDQPTHWTTWVTGIEQTAITTLCSPPAGPHLISGYGDLGGFVHEDLNQSPPQGMFENPHYGAAEILDYAGAQPNVLVRSGTVGEHGVDGSPDSPVAVSDDSGKTWQQVALPKEQAAGKQSVPPVVISADGQVVIIVQGSALLTTDRGQTWAAVKGLPDGVRPVADRVKPNVFYAVDFSTGQFYQSTDGARSFSAQPCEGLPSDTQADHPGWVGSFCPLQAVPGREGEMWYVGKAGLFHSEDGGKIFAAVPSDVHVNALSFGKGAPGSQGPALFAIGQRGSLKAIWRSDDTGRSWSRINDDQHEWGRRFRCICGDPRIVGRVYVGTDGRAVLYGDVSHQQ